MGLLLWRFVVVGLCVCFARWHDGFSSLFFFFLSSLSSLTFLFLFPVASLFLSGSRFELLPSKVRQSGTSKPKCLRSVAADMEVELDGVVI